MVERLRTIDTEQQFRTDVLAADGLVLVVFWAEWSGACHLMAPVIGDVARELRADVAVFCVDIDRVDGLSARYGVESTPAFLFFRDGRLVNQVVGTIPKKPLVTIVRALMQ